MNQPALQPIVIGIVLLALVALPTTDGWTQETVDVNAGRGDVSLYVPESYSDDEPMPLVVILHGFSGNGAGIESYWDMENQAEEDGFLLAYPDGSLNGVGLRFWNATPACCAGGAVVDDSTYLMELVGEIQIQYTVDTRRIYFAGHSNGGFMSHRLACDHSETIAAIGSLAGAVFDDTDDCDAEDPVHILQVHGTADLVILYDGGTTFWDDYPGAEDTVETWAELNGCELVSEDGDDLDLDGAISGSETSVTRYTSECDSGGSSELWAISGGSHSPSFNADWAAELAAYFLDHPKNCETISWRTQNARLVDEGLTGSARSGSSLSLVGPWLVVGARRDEVDGFTTAGSASVFVRDGRIWSLHARLTDEDPDSFDQFGSSVATDGGFAVIGSPFDDEGEDNAGSATVYRRSGPDWIRETKLTLENPEESAEFGSAVAVGGDVIFVAAPKYDSPDESTGSVFAYRRIDEVWTLEQEVIASDGGASDRFGSDLAFDGTTLAIGARGWDGDADEMGAIYIFTWDGNEWFEDDILTASDPALGDSLGVAVAIDGDVLVAGSPQNDEVASNGGAAYVFENDGVSWSETQKLTAEGLLSTDSFGTDVAVDGTDLLITADAADVDLGSAYIFRYDEDLGEWFEAQDVKGVGRTEDGNFGAAGALDGGAIAVGAPLTSQGEVGVFLLADCNQNGLRDSCDIEDGTSDDCNTNGIPDDCEIVEPTILIDPQPEVVCLNGTAIFEVTALAEADATYVWRFEGVEIADSDASELVLEDVTAEDAGEYDVVITDACGETTSAVAELTIETGKDAPVIDEPLSDVASYVGAQAILTVTASGDNLDYLWRRDGVLLVGENSATLTLDPVELDDAGEYTVVVSNACESEERTAVLTVYLTAPFLRADVDTNGTVEALPDAVYLLDAFFADGSEILCSDAADVDDDGVVSALVDTLTLLLWAYLDGPAPADPGAEECGFDDTDDDLTCDEPSADCL